VKFTALLDAIRAAELDESAARAMQPRHAFARACKKVSDSRIIRQVAEDENNRTFQFTAESRSGDSFQYTLETLLRLDKQSGVVRCDLPGLAILAQEHLDRAMENRNGADITRVIRKLFDRQADLFPIREKGAVYFVAERFAEFVDRVQKFVSAVGGRLARFPVPVGTPQGDRSVKEAVAEGLGEIIAEHRAAMNSFGDDTRESTIRRAAERVRATRFKLEAYADLLLEERGRLERELAEAGGRPEIVGGASPGTNNRYRSVRDKHQAYCANHGIMSCQRFDAKAAEQFAHCLEKEGYAYRTLYLELTTLKSAVLWLIDSGPLPAGNRLRLELPRAQGTDTYCYSKEQVVAMIDHCRTRPELRWLMQI
jgi:hypothetical protein